MKHKFIVAFLLSMLIVCFYLFNIIYSEAKERAVFELNARQMINAQQAKSGIEAYFNDVIKFLTKLSESNHIINFDDKSKNELDFALKIQPEGIKAITRVDASGKITYTTPFNKSVIGRDISNQKHVKKILAIQRPVVSDVFMTVQGYRAIALHVPVFNGNEFRGTLAVLIDFLNISKRFLQDIRVGETGYAWITSSEGIELYCPVPGHTGKSVFENCKAFPSILSMANEMVKGKQGATTYTFDRIRNHQIEAVKKFAVYLPIKIVDSFWTIVIATSEKEALAALVSLKNKFAMVVSLLLLCSAIFSYYSFRALGIIKEAAKRKKIEKALRESEEKYRLLTENVSDVIWTMDMDMHYTYISPAIEKIQGWSAEEAASLTINDVLTPQSIEITLNRMAAHLADGAKTGNYNISDRFELELYCKDGTTIWAEILASSIIGEDGLPVGILGVTRDITERNKLETQLQRAQKMEAIGTLAGGVAHDLNNILSAQVSYPDLILMDLPEDSPLRGLILTIQKSGKKAAAIVQDLLTLARRGVVATEVVNLNNIIDDYIKSPEYENLMEFHTGVKIKCDIEPDLLNIMGSSVHLATTVANMFSNAIEAMPGGGNVYISTRNKYIDTPIRGYENVKEGDYVVLTVSDSGAGISSGDLEKIFEPFYTKKVMGRSGTGLGMAVVWGTIKDHKGYIEVQSTEGKGTNFNLYFPITRKEVGVKGKSLSMGAYKGKGESILVVDDVEEQREIAFRILDRLNYSVTSVSSGEEAVDYMKNNSADLLVLDMIMEPGIDGFETYRRILELHPGQKAIIASGFSETDIVKEAQRLGAGEYLKKPYTLETIGLAVKEEFKR